MGPEVDKTEEAPEGLPDTKPEASSKPVQYSYGREFLLSFADVEICRKRPEGLDQAVWREASVADGEEGGVAVPGTSSRGLVRRDRDSEASSRSPVDVPEWRKDSWRSGGSGAPLPQGPRRKPYDEEPFSTSYPPRPPAGNWGDNGHPRNSYERSGLQGQGSGRWDHRTGLPDRDRELGRPFQKLDGEETDAVRAEGVRPLGNVGPGVRPAWLPVERDGLLGSGGGLHRTYTGNFASSPSALSRQMSLGPPERQMSLGPLERQMATVGVPDRQMGLVPPERLMSMVPPERQMSMVPPERQMSLGPPERQMSLGPPERQMSLGPMEHQMGIGRQMSLGPMEHQAGIGRQMSLGPPERQMSMGPPERQISMGRLIPRPSDPYPVPRPLKGPIFPRREETDSVNDETFGSEESSTNDRADQERKRRESFELMRKGHQRQLQKQQNVLTQMHEERLANPASVDRKHDESGLWDSTPGSSRMSSSPPKSPQKSLRSEEVISSGVATTPSITQSIPRPAVPPGFAKVLQQQIQTPTNADEKSRAGEMGEKKEASKQTGLQNESAPLLQDKDVRYDVGRTSEKLSKIHLGSDRSEVVDSPACVSGAESAVVCTPIMEAEDFGSQCKPPAGKDGKKKAEEWSVGPEGVADENVIRMSSANFKEDIFTAAGGVSNGRESLLDKWFGRTDLVYRSSEDGLVSPSQSVGDELQSKAPKVDTWSDTDSKAAMFAEWRQPEDRRAKVNSVGKTEFAPILPLSGIQGSTSGMSQAEDRVAQAEDLVALNVPWTRGRILPMPSGPSLEDVEKGLTAMESPGYDQNFSSESDFQCDLSLKKPETEPKVNGGVSARTGLHSAVDKGKFKAQSPPTQRASGVSPVFLTCEDIELSMLAEAGSSHEKRVPKPGGGARKKERQSGDSEASRHLLSLLHKGAGGGQYSPDSGPAAQSVSAATVAKAVPEASSRRDDQGRNTAESHGRIEAHTNSSSETSTLASLFGTAFMNELRSVEAPPLSGTTFAGDWLSNKDGMQALSGLFPASSRHLGDAASNVPPKSKVANHWPEGMRLSSSMAQMEKNGMDGDRRGHSRGPFPSYKADQPMAIWKDERFVPASGGTFWGDDVAKHLVDGIVVNKNNLGSNLEGTSLLGDGLTGSRGTAEEHPSRLNDFDVDILTSSKVIRDGTKNMPANVKTDRLRVSKDSTLASSQELPGDKVFSGQNRSFDSSGLPQVLAEDGVTVTTTGDLSTPKFGSVEFSGIRIKENTAAVSQALDDFLSASQTLDRQTIVEDVAAINGIGSSGEERSGNERRIAGNRSDTVGFVGKHPQVGNGTASTIAAAGFMEQANAGLARANSTPMRFQNNIGGLQPTSGFSSLQSSIGALPLQHQQSLGAQYRSESSKPPSFQARTHGSNQGHAQMQHNLSPAALAMFPPQQFQPQPGLPQQQQHLLGRSINNGSSVDFAHVHFGHLPHSGPIPGGHPQFPPAVAHGHLPQPGMYHSMGTMGPTPNHFLPAGAQVPARGPGLSAMAESNMFLQEQALLDPLGGSKQGPQQAPSLFPLSGIHPFLSYGQGLPMFPQPHNMRGQQQQGQIPGPGPWVVSHPTDLMRTGSKGHELAAAFANGGGLVAPNQLDRWFGMELARNGSGIPAAPNFAQLSSAHGLDSESALRFG